MFVQRDDKGNIKGLYANRQPGYAEEEITEDHKDVRDYRNRPEVKAWTVAALVKALKRKGQLTDADLD